MAFLDRTARSFLLTEIVSGMAITLRYMFKPSVTLNYPYEKGPLMLSRVKMAVDGPRAMTSI